MAGRILINANHTIREIARGLLPQRKNLRLLFSQNQAGLIPVYLVKQVSMVSYNHPPSQALLLHQLGDRFTCETHFISAIR